MRSSTLLPPQLLEPLPASDAAAGSELPVAPPWEQEYVLSQVAAGLVWWYSERGQQRGPVTGTQLAALLATDWQELATAVGRLPAGQPP